MVLVFLDIVGVCSVIVVVIDTEMLGVGVFGGVFVDVIVLCVIL